MQAVFGIVGQQHGFVVAVDRVDGHHGTEDFVAGKAIKSLCLNNRVAQNGSVG